MTMHGQIALSIVLSQRREKVLWGKADCWEACNEFMNARTEDCGDGPSRLISYIEWLGYLTLF